MRNDLAAARIPCPSWPYNCVYLNALSPVEYNSDLGIHCLLWNELIS